jgi:hypothetical protein
MDKRFGTSNTGAIFVAELDGQNCRVPAARGIQQGSSIPAYQKPALAGTFGNVGRGTVRFAGIIGGTSRCKDFSFMSEQASVRFEGFQNFRIIRTGTALIQTSHPAVLRHHHFDTRILRNVQVALEYSFWMC